ncbi:MAG: DVU0298 family protein [Desulfovibrionaceae bacterium]
MHEREQVRSRIEQALDAADFPQALAAVGDIAPKKRLAPLFSALLAPEPLRRWRAAVALGAAAADLAEAAPESARDLWRNLMWRLNEESGTIGWGIPEVMGEALARSPFLADAYHRILFGYVRELPGDSTFIDHEPLRRGVWWAIARLAAARPVLVRREALDVLYGALTDPDPTARGLACLALSRLGRPANSDIATRLTGLVGDRAELTLFADDRLRETTVGALAGAALASEGGV